MSLFLAVFAIGVAAPSLFRLAARRGWRIPLAWSIYGLTVVAALCWWVRHDLRVIAAGRTHPIVIVNELVTVPLGVGLMSADCYRVPSIQGAASRADAASRAASQGMSLSFGSR